MTVSVIIMMSMIMRVIIPIHKTHPCFSSIITKGHNFSDFLFAFLDDEKHGSISTHLKP